MLLNQLRISLIALLVFTILTGMIYPLLVTGISQLLFPSKANGSLIVRDGIAAGSELIGQQFREPRYFWSRPSATLPFAYNAASSSGSNDGPLNPSLLDDVRKRIHDLKEADPGNLLPVPVDLVTASASGLDPHISIAAARYQIPRIARERHLNREEVRRLVDRFTEPRDLGILGEPRVNVLKLNLALDEHFGLKGKQ